MITVTTILVALLCLGLWYLYQKKRNKYYKNIPGPPTIPILGNALDFRSTTLTMKNMIKYVKKYGELVKVEIGPFKRLLLVTDYKLLDIIFSSTNPLLFKKSNDYQFVRRWLGNGLLIGEGSHWEKHRKLLTPAFHFKILQQFVDVFESCGQVLLEKLEKEVDKDSVDIIPFITMCTLDIICESTMGTNINAQNDVESEYVQSVKEMCRIVGERAVSPLQMYERYYRLTKNYRTETKALEVLHGKANSVIINRMKELENKFEEDDHDDTFGIKKKRALLDTLLEAKANGQPLSQEDIRQEVDTFMFGGHDTTATVICFTLFCLANHPEVQKLVYEEQQAIFEENEAISYAKLQEMKYLELVIKETLRLYPPVPIIGRQSTEDLVYENTLIPKGDSLLIFSYGIHRDPKYFDDPETFNPSRFVNSDGKYPYSYIPFSAGARNCIAQKFAMLEMKNLISKIVRKFELHPTVPAHTLELSAEAVLTSINGIKICLKLR